MSAPETDAPAADSRLGQLLSGRYRIEQLLGEGGMGAVYLAEHTHMRKRVALKLLHPEMSDNPEVAARFEREALAASHVEHPNVAAATDFGKTDDGAFFLVLEYIEGTSLREALAGGPFATARALHVARQISAALERAHEAGIVHRDLKPENVMLVRREDDPDFVKVLDFGIAKLSAEAMGERAASSQPLTRLGTVLGTPEYMAPEQALGEAVTPQADLYAVGVILYEMLTGRHPFDGGDHVAMMSSHLVSPVPPMRERAPTVVVPASVEALVRRLLEKDRAARPPSARALVDEIDRVAGRSSARLLAVGDPSAAPPTSTLGGAPGSTAAVAATSQRFDADAFAKTSLGGPASAAGAPPSPAGAAIAALKKQPPAVLAAVIAAPLLLALVVTVVIGFRTRVERDGAEGDKGDESVENVESVEREPPGKTAPPARVEAATALGVEALATLAAEFPEDGRVARELAVAFCAEGRNAECVRVATTLTTAPTQGAGANVGAGAGAGADANADDTLLRAVAGVASKDAGEAGDAATALLEGAFGAAGVDALFEISTSAAKTKATREARARASKSLAKPEVRARAKAATLVLLDFKGAQSCTQKRALLARANEGGDARLLASLRPLRATRGCGFFKRSDCWPCLRRDDALERAIKAIEARSAGDDARDDTPP